MMARQKVRQTDPKTGKLVWGEYLTYLEDWYGVDFLGVKIAPAVSVQQGLYFAQQKEPDVETDVI